MTFRRPAGSEATLMLQAMLGSRLPLVIVASRPLKPALATPPAIESRGTTAVCWRPGNKLGPAAKGGLTLADGAGSYHRDDRGNDQEQ